MTDMELLRSGIVAEVRAIRDKAQREADMWRTQPGSQDRVAREQGRVSACNEILMIVERP